MATRTRALPGFLVVLMAGCQSGTSSVPLPRTDPDTGASSARDAAADRAPADAAPPMGEPSAVTGHQIGHWLSDQPDLDGPTNFSNSKINAWAPLPDGTWKFFPGQGTPDGKLTVPGVPAGPFLFRLGWDYFASSTARSFDLDFTSLGRPSRPTPKVRPTTISVVLTGLQ